MDSGNSSTTPLFASSDDIVGHPDQIGDVDDGFSADSGDDGYEAAGGAGKVKKVKKSAVSKKKPAAAKKKAMAGGTAPLALFEAPLAADGADVSIGEPDLTSEQMRPLSMAGGAASPQAAQKRTYHVLKVTGAPMPSLNAKYTSPTPSMALRKAASRIFRQSKQKALRFTVLMRRVSPKHADRELYEYNVTMVKRAVPTGFVAVRADTFKSWNKSKGAWGAAQKDVSKNVRIVQKTDAAPYGYISPAGLAVAGDVAGQSFPLYRPAKTNTLLLALPGAMPATAQGLPVIKTTHDVKSARSTNISAADAKQYDTAGAVRERQAALEEARKAKAKAKKAAARAKKD